MKIFGIILCLVSVIRFRHYHQLIFSRHKVATIHPILVGYSILSSVLLSNILFIYILTNHQTKFSHLQTFCYHQKFKPNKQIPKPNTVGIHINKHNILKISLIRLNLWQKTLCISSSSVNLCETKNHNQIQQCHLVPRLRESKGLMDKSLTITQRLIKLYFYA